MAKSIADYSNNAWKYYTGCPTPGNRHTVVVNGEARIDGDRGLILEGDGNDWLTVPTAEAYTSTDLMIDKNAADIVLEYWYKPDLLVGTQYPSEFGMMYPTALTPVWGFGAMTDGRLAFVTNRSGTRTLASASGIVTVDSWQHLCWVRSSGICYLFHNGVQVATAAFDRPYDDGLYPTIGKNTASTSYGTMSGLAVYRDTDLGRVGGFTPPARGKNLSLTNAVLALEFCGDAGGEIYDSARPA
jgi:hypothetical protein